MRIVCQWARPTSCVVTNAAALGREAIVMAHDELRFHLLHGVHSYADNDQQAGAAKIEVEAEPLVNTGGRISK